MEEEISEEADEVREAWEGGGELEGDVNKDVEAEGDEELVE